jgi:hypothetical protein
MAAQQNQKLTEFFGPPSGPLTTSEYGHYDHFALPTAYLGKNLFLRDTIDGFIMDDNTWYTSKCLPYQRTNDLNIQWNEIRFDEHMVDRVPTEGVSRLIKSQRTRHNEKTVRRGIAFILEHGFMNTEEGKQQYILNIRQIKQAVQQTNNLDVVATCFYTPRYDKIWEKKHNIGQDIQQQYADECANFAIVQKDAHGLDVLHQQFKQKMARHGVTPNMWIFPPKMSMYLNMVSRENKEQWLAGDQGVARFNDPNNGTRFRDVTVYECATFLDNSEEPINVLKRPVQTGEYYRMEPVEYRKDSYKSKHRDVFIYDESKDNFQRITMKEAVKNCMRWGEDDKLDDNDFTNVNADIFTFMKDGEYNRCRVWGDVEDKYITKAMLKEMNDAMEKKTMNITPADLSAAFPVERFQEENVAINIPTSQLVKECEEKLESSPLSSVSSHFKNAMKKYEKHESFDNVAAGMHDWLHSNDLNSEDVKGQYNVLKKITGDVSKDKTYWKRIGVSMDQPVKKQLQSFQRFSKKSKASTSIDDILGNVEPVSAKPAGESNTNGIKKYSGSFDNLKAWLDSEITLSSIENLIDKDIPLPFTMLLMRPFMEYEMCSAILMKGGSETGGTYVGHNSFTLGDDVQSKLHYGNYTYYAKAVVREPRNIVIAENVFSDGYVGGNNTKFFKRGDNVDEAVSRSSPSLIAMLVPADTREHMEQENPIDIRGSFNKYTDKQNHFVGAEYYNQVAGTGSLDDVHPDNETYTIDERIHTNTRCYLGHYMFWGGSAYDKVNVNTGAWGPNVYPGCGKVRNGQMKYLENQRYSSSYM